MKKRLLACRALTLAIALAVPVRADGGRASAGLGRPLVKGYTYNYWGTASPAPAPYGLEAIITGNALGCGDFNEPADVCFDADGNLYVADSLNNRVVKISPDLVLAGEYKSFAGASPESLSHPSGVFAAQGGDIYISDTDNARVLRVSQDGVLLDEFPEPDGPLIPEGFVYRPTRLAADPSGRVYVVAASVNQGIIILNPDGSFDGFLAAAKVNPDPLQILWKRIATDEQRARMQNFVPIEYNSVDIDSEGFLYTTTATVDEKIIIAETFAREGTEQGSPVRRINMNGQDILRRKGYFPPVGDVYNLQDTAPVYSGVSRLTDVAACENGAYIVLDNNRKRLFAFDEDGFLLFAFGGPGASAGGFITPIACAVSGSRVVVADKSNSVLSVLKRTDFAERIYAAIDYYAHGEYALAEAEWQSVMERDANHEMAYVGMGRSAYRDGRYEDAMAYFKQGGNKQWYSKAYAEHRKTIIAKWLPLVAGALLLALAAGTARRFIKYA
ncbi:MAG: NHL repeat-containing protein, partial [Clostridiales bacterium]|nr:NHL repeat-containing protein [Clostridiales bacterium]